MCLCCLLSGDSRSPYHEGMATFRQLLVLGLVVLIAYAAHIYDNSPMSPQPFSAEWMEYMPHTLARSLSWY